MEIEGGAVVLMKLAGSSPHVLWLQRAQLCSTGKREIEDVGLRDSYCLYFRFCFWQHAGKNGRMLGMHATYPRRTDGRTPRAQASLVRDHKPD
jgi:hypothetical protein